MTLTAAQAADDTAALGKISNSDYGVGISDRAQNVAANFDALEAETQISAITLTDVETPVLSLTTVEALDDTAVLGKITNTDYAVAAVDTVANVLTNGTALHADTAIASIEVSDTAANIISNSSALGDDAWITSVNVVDTAAHVSNDLTTLNGNAQIASITLTDSGTPTLTLSAAQATTDTKALTAISNHSYAIALSDSVVHVSAALDELNSESQLSSITLTDSGTPTLTCSLRGQALD